MVTQAYLDQLTYKINGACIEVHRTMGPGLLESVYSKCLAEEFRLRNIAFIDEYNVPLVYKGIQLNCDFFCDFLVEDLIVLELKSVKEITDIHRAQLMNYINLAKKPKGILVNFNVKNLMHEGHQTFVNKWFTELL